jgi:hypothetical protein
MRSSGPSVRSPLVRLDAAGGGHEVSDLLFQACMRLASSASRRTSIMRPYGDASAPARSAGHFPRVNLRIVRARGHFRSSSVTIERGLSRALLGFSTCSASFWVELATFTIRNPSHRRPPTTGSLQSMVRVLLRLVAGLARSRASLVAENEILRLQLAAAKVIRPFGTGRLRRAAVGLAS